MSDSTRSEAAIAAYYVLQGRNGKARRQYHAAFRLAYSAEEVMTIFKNIFVHQAVDTAKRGNVSGAQELHRFACQMWGETEMWELLSAALIKQVFTTSDHAVVWNLRSAIIDCRPATMSLGTAMHFFWKRTDIKVRRLPRPTRSPKDHEPLFDSVSERMPLVLH